MANIDVEVDVDVIVDCNDCGKDVIAGEVVSGNTITIYANMCSTCLSAAVEEARENGYNNGFDAGVQSMDY